MSELVEIGKVRKVHGYKGELKLIIHDGYETDVIPGKFLFFGKEHSSALPYQILDVRGIDHILALAGVETKEECASLTGKIAYLRKQDVTEQHSEEPQKDETYDRLVGFNMVDESIGEVGLIESTEQYPQQILATVKRIKKAGKILVPLNPDLIKGVDFTRRIVFMDLPEGLVDL